MIKVLGVQKTARLKGIISVLGVWYEPRLSKFRCVWRRVYAIARLLWRSLCAFIIAIFTKVISCLCTILKKSSGHLMLMWYKCFEFCLLYSKTLCPIWVSDELISLSQRTNIQHIKIVLFNLSLELLDWYT